MAYGDVFTGTLSFCGVNFYKDVAAPQGKYYPATFVPDPGVLLLSKRSGRLVLLTGEFDENRQNTKQIYMSGFKREGFRSVLYLEIPGMSHAMPEVEIFRKSLNYLAGKTE